MIEVWRADISLNIDWIGGKPVRFYGLHSKITMRVVFPDGTVKTITIDGAKRTFYWNGANYVVDLLSLAPLFHDRITGNSLPEPYKHDGCWLWDDGTLITVWESSYVLKYIYKMEKRKYTGNRRGRWTYLYQAIKRKWKGRKREKK